MIKFKVIKGPVLLVSIAAVLLALVIFLLVLRYAVSGDEPATSAGSFVEQTGAEAVSVFASAQGAEVSVISPDEDEHTDEAVKVEIEPMDEYKPVVTHSPRVLIYHTHTHEAYEQVEGDTYAALEAWRTADESHSIVRVGAELARLLRERGFHVVHDATDHEQNELSTAYSRSLDTLNGYDESFDLYIDLHRDAYPQGTPVSLNVNGVRHARLMLLIGNGDGFDEKPHYAENLAFASALTEKLNSLQPGICREVMVKKGRYNQHIGIYSILIEAGHNLNTLQEALNSLPYLADALEELMLNSTAKLEARQGLAMDIK